MRSGVWRAAGSGMGAFGHRRGEMMPGMLRSFYSFRCYVGKSELDSSYHHQSPSITADHKNPVILDSLCACRGPGALRGTSQLIQHQHWPDLVTTAADVGGLAGVPRAGGSGLVWALRTAYCVLKISSFVGAV